LEVLKQSVLGAGEIPRCRECASLVKTATISFGQPMPPEPMMRAEAEALACDETTNCILWANDDGQAAFELVASLRLASEKLDPIEPASWPPLFRSLAMKTPVRAAFGRHPRLAILGPLEARLQHFDLTILGGLNEGVWPRGAGTDPWFSRPMRATLGLEQPERSIGLSAHDFAMLAAGPNVLLTRSLKAEGTPTIASRWLQRLQQLTQGLDLKTALAPVQAAGLADAQADASKIIEGAQIKAEAGELYTAHFGDNGW
jgi:ATP-dependent helicase/nuclease subunit B